MTEVSNPLSYIFPPKSTTALVDNYLASSFLAFDKSVDPTMCAVWRVSFYDFVNIIFLREPTISPLTTLIAEALLTKALPLAVSAPLM